MLWRMQNSYLVILLVTLKPYPSDIALRLPVREQRLHPERR